MKVTSNSIRHDAKSAEGQKISLPKVSVDLYKLVLNKIMTTHN